MALIDNERIDCLKNFCVSAEERNALFLFLRLMPRQLSYGCERALTMQSMTVAYFDTKVRKTDVILAYLTDKR